MSHDEKRILFVIGLPQASRPWQQQCVWYRVVGPGQALQCAGCHVEYAYLEEGQRIHSLLHTGAVHAVILHRGSSGADFQRLRDATRASGIPLFYDLDDNIIDPEAIERASHLAHLNSATICEIQDWTRTNISCLAECEGGLFSTTFLRDVGLRHNENSRLFANFLPAFYTAPAIQPAQRKDRNVRIYYGAGSTEHKVHLDLVAEALAEVMRQNQEVELYIGGGLEKPRPLDAYTSRVVLLPWVRPEIYYRMLGRMDVVLAPLVPDPFTAAKSWIKALEAASAGCIWIGSGQPSYQEFSALTGTGFLVQNQGWETALHFVLGNFSFERQRALERRHSICEQFNIASRTGEYLRTIGCIKETA